LSSRFIPWPRTLWVGFIISATVRLSAVIYLALIGDAKQRHWGRAILFALGLELGMLLTPYPRVFNIPLTARFVIVTIAAHAVFGAGLGLAVRWLVPRYRQRPLITAPSA